MITVSAGVIVTNGSHILLGHVTGNRHWDIPKGVIDHGETALSAAIRELDEETSLVVSADQLVYAGPFGYKPHKSLELWIYPIDIMPDVSRLDCRSTFVTRRGETRKELDSFASVTWADARSMVVTDMWEVLQQVYMDHVDTCNLGGSDHDD
jgi:8-oxo-dGTP pyrophosphatase MutT (NUDIX family)